MIAWCVLVGCLAGQDPQDVEKLKKELEGLRERVEQLERQTTEDAALIHRLRQALKAHDGASGAAPESPATPPGTGPNAAVKGPQKVLRGRVSYVETKLAFLLINLGEADGVKAGYRFEILREEQPPGGAPPRLRKVGVAEFEKFMGDDRRMSKLKVIEGNAAEMRDGDEAVAYRDVETPLPAPPKAPEPSRPGVYKITGRAGTGYVTSYGSLEGAHPSQVVMAYRDGKLKAKLRLDTVEKTFSVGNVIDGTQILPIEEDDQVYTAEMRKTAIGKVRVSDEKSGIFVDVGQNNFGVKVGDRLEVRRLGQRIGAIRLTKVDKFHSWAQPDGETKREDIIVNDTVEIISEK